jgi:hypothetical protein
LEPKTSQKLLSSIPLLLVLIGSIVSASLGFKGSHTLASFGRVSYPPEIFVTVDFSKVVAVNNLSLGVMLDWEWKSWLNSPALREKAAAVNFKLIRLFDFRVKPCVYWNESSKTGIYDWTDFDALVRSIFEVGAEPIITLGYYEYGKGPRIPAGMAVNPETDLPYPESFGAYAAELVRYFKNSVLGVRYWEIWNEPHSYIFERKDDGSYVWGVSNKTRLEAFVKLFNVTSAHMRSVDSEILIGTDASLYKSFFDCFVRYGEGVGFLSFHKYDAWGTWLHNPEGYLSDEEILKKAGRIGDKWTYTPEEARQIWREIRKVDIPVICSETNLNSAWENGTDPRIQQVIGAVWYTETLKTYILSDVRFSVYYCFVSDNSPRWNTTKPTRGAGFGMVNMTPPHDEWYPYLANYLLGNHLSVDDVIYYTVSSNLTAMSVLAWKHENQFKVLLNYKGRDQSILAKIQFAGIELDPKTEINVYRIDELNRGIQSKVVTWSEASTIIMKSYSIVLFSFLIA